MNNKETKHVNCPLCEKEMRKSLFYGNEIDFCPSCLGIWFEKDELRRAKDEKEETLNWLDVDLWDKEEDFRISKEEKKCPSCSLPMYEVEYGESKIKVDLCGVCEGVWLDRGEFKKIIEHLKEKGGSEIMNNYVKTLIEETGEVFTGPEELSEEVSDLLTVVSLLKYRFAGKHPYLSKTISDIPKS